MGWFSIHKIIRFLTHKYCKLVIFKKISPFSNPPVCSPFKSSHRRCFVKKVFLVNKVAGLRPATLFKKILWHRCFPVNFAKLLRTPFLQSTSGLLLLPILRVLCSIFGWECFNTKCSWIHSVPLIISSGKLIKSAR